MALRVLGNRPDLGGILQPGLWIGPCMDWARFYEKIGICDHGVTLF